MSDAMTRVVLTEVDEVIAHGDDAIILEDANEDQSRWLRDTPERRAAGRMREALRAFIGWAENAACEPVEDTIARGRAALAAARGEGGGA